MSPAPLHETTSIHTWDPSTPGIHPHPGSIHTHACTHLDGGHRLEGNVPRDAIKLEQDLAGADLRYICIAAPAVQCKMPDQNNKARSTLGSSWQPPPLPLPPTHPANPAGSVCMPLPPPTPHR